ncbi:MAG: hypothetical protein ABI224_13410 [Acetobacteraceae bacterium]
MTGHHSRNRIGDGSAPVGIDIAANVHVFVKPRRSGPSQREFVLWRAWAWLGEEEPADRGDEQKPTERGQDKSRQCAARLGYCFTWTFLPFRQGAPDPRNVRADIKFLLSLSFPHIAGAGDGA